MLQDKVMVNDLLSMEKSSLAIYANAISESSNTQLRQTLQQIRNNCEASQYNLYKLAESKGFYQAASKANPQEMQQVKSQFESSSSGNSSLGSSSSGSASYGSSSSGSSSSGSASSGSSALDRLSSGSASSGSSRI